MTIRVEVLGVMGITEAMRTMMQAPNYEMMRKAVGITVSETPPENPQINDIWIDIS